ncbi:MAG TPA: DJ-1/PfpI family protein [Steroidobacteraceae bacterium]|nr:DJ-1/PfpI family protein [Steroidobacteraceae bacterium]
MSTVDRRTAALLALFGPLLAVPAARAAPPSSRPRTGSSQVPPGWVRHDVIAQLVYPNMTALDLVGPHYMFALLMGAKVHLVAKTPDPVKSDLGLTITPTTTFADCPRDLTVLFAPGGTGAVAAAGDPQTRAFIADRGKRAKYVTSVCTGSLILGAAGLLEGYRATSHWAARDLLADFGAIPTDQRVVRDRNRITGAGVTSGLDFGLTMVSELRDAFYAECAQLLAEYDPHPPFDSGSMHTAPAKVRQTMTPWFADLRAHTRELARRLKA